jgi:hypothetical protein
MTPAQFLHALWGPKPPGLVQLWSASTKRTTYLHELGGLDALDLDPVDLYTGVGLSPTAYNARQRCKAHDIAAIAGLWLDVDIANDKCPTDSAAHQIAGAIAEPTLVIHSGGGLHVWHLFEKPLELGTPATRSNAAILADAWVTAHQGIAAGHGWKLDAVKDLARLLRVPGTLNGKTDPPRPVQAVVTDGPRYTPYLLNQLVKEHVPAAMARHRRRVGTPDADIGAFNTKLPPSIDGTLLADLMEIVPEFAATWRRERPDFKNDQSTYDMSLAHWALEAGWTDQQTVDLLREHRKRHNPQDPKVNRPDYYARTLRAAKNNQDTNRRRAEHEAAAARIHALRNGEAA